jgi:hypothetical protein
MVKRIAISMLMQHVVLHRDMPTMLLRIRATLDAARNRTNKEVEGRRIGVPFCGHHGDVDVLKSALKAAFARNDERLLHAHAKVGSPGAG